MTREEFRSWAEERTGRFERIGGEPVAMVPGRVAHVRVKSRVWAALERAIQRADVECEALGDGITVEVDDDTDYEPDAVVNCGPTIPADAIAATRPIIVVEVLSPSTQSVDSGEKLAGYFKVPSIQHYLVFGTRRREVVHHARQGDAIVSRVLNIGQITLEPPGIVFDLDDVYGR